MRILWRVIDEARGRFRRRPLTIVTGADASHGASLGQFVASVVRHEPEARLIVYDLGLDQTHRSAIAATAPRATLKRFAFERYPDWFDIRVSAGQYAWKPVIVATELKDAPGPLVWMDAGNVLLGRLHRLYGHVARLGFYSPNSSGDLAQWTHPGTLAHLGLTVDWTAGRRNVNGACVAFAPAHPQARALAETWAELAQVREAIAPEGASRANHRQDQALLGVLAHRAGLISNRREPRMRFATQQDIDPPTVGRN